MNVHRRPLTGGSALASALLTALSASVAALLIGTPVIALALLAVVVAGAALLVSIAARFALGLPSGLRPTPRPLTGARGSVLGAPSVRRLTTPVAPVAFAASAIEGGRVRGARGWLGRLRAGCRFGAARLLLNREWR